jgi:hypothetical protein
MDFPSEPEDRIQMLALDGSKRTCGGQIKTKAESSVSVFCGSAPEIGASVRLECPRCILLAEVVAVQKNVTGVLARLEVRHFFYQGAAPDAYPS